MVDFDEVSNLQKPGNISSEGVTFDKVVVNEKDFWKWSATMTVPLLKTSWNVSGHAVSPETAIAQMREAVNHMNGPLLTR